MSKDNASTGHGQPDQNGHRVPYVAACQAMRQSIERALAAKDTTAGDLRVLLVVLAQTASWSKLSDSTTRAAIADAAGVSEATAKRALARLDAVDAIDWKPVRGQGKRHSIVAIPAVSNGSWGDPFLDRETGHLMTQYSGGNGSPDDPRNGSPHEPLPRSSSEKKAAEPAGSNVTKIENPTTVISSRLGCSTETAAKIAAEIHRKKAAAGDPVRNLPGLLRRMEDDELRVLLHLVEQPPDASHPADSQRVYVDESAFPGDHDDIPAYQEWLRNERARQRQINRDQWDAKYGSQAGVNR
jgi:hypothetical protein